MAINHRKNDDYYTPIEALEPLLPIIQGYSCVYEPFCGDNHITNFLKEHNKTVIARDIIYGRDFFDLNDRPNQEDYDIIISNPPFSKKTEVLRELYNIGKPFLMLLNITTIDSKARLSLFKENGFSMFLLPQRTNFISDGIKTNSCYFYCCWIGWNIEGYENNRVYYLY